MLTIARTMTGVAVVIILVLGSGIKAVGATESTYEVVSPPRCTNNLGETVVFKERRVEGNQFAAGMAIREQDSLPVVYRFNFDQSPPVFQRFIDLHECAHHQTGDIDRPHPPRNSPEHLMNESIADCIAILRVREDADGDQQAFERTANALRDVMRLVGFPDISTDSRVSNIRNCFDNYESAEIFIDGVLRERGLR